MDKFWIFFVLIGATYVFADSALKANKNVPLEELDKAYDEDWYPDEVEKLGILNKDEQDNKNDGDLEELGVGESIETGDYYEELEEAVNLPSIEEESSKDLEEEVEKLSSKELAKKSEENDNGGEVFDTNIDYQIEDNRSELKYDQKDGEDVVDSKVRKNMDENDIAKQTELDNEDFEDLNDNSVANEENSQEITDEKVSSLETHQIECDDEILNQVFDEESSLLDETKDILNEESDNNDFNDLEAEASQQVETQLDLADETKSILEEADTFMDNEINKSTESNNDVKDISNEGKLGSVETFENKNKDQDENDEDVENIYADLQNDLDKLVDTWKKLQEPDEDTKADEPLNQEEILEYEEKYGRPFKEGIVLQQREDYDTFYDDNLSELFEDDNNASIENVDENINGTDSKSHDDEYEQVNDSNLSKIFKEFDEQTSKENPPSLTNDMMQENENEQDNVEQFSVDAENRQSGDEESKDVESQLNKEILYKNDALMAHDDDSIQDEEAATSNVDENKQVNVHQVKKMNVNDLSADDLEQFMKRFEVIHNSDTLATDCDGNVGPIRKSLSVDQPLIVSSCEFPNRYPTNKVMDWILDGAGNGMGIELNFTDLDLNGALGDYVLINPGQADSSGRDGLVFSFHLNSERRYRFLDVNRIFIRFEANPGMAFRTGFRLSIKLVEPLREIQPEQAPEPEALIPPPSATLTVNLGGVTLQEFLDIEEEFRRLVADMATMYINANNIDPGLNTTFETTQIVSRSICNIRWPNFENCAEVKFGIPLVRNDDDDEEESRLNEEDLSAMWSTYIERDPFAARLRRMGVVEFAVPNDSSVFTAWVVIAVGVVISVAMLAFALWRFSCFEDYTRMAAYSDSDSFSNEKRGLDLYPTPHQTLPPLYSDVDYKWADNKHDDSTRVDMSGFANKSYVQEDLFNLDSEDEVIASHERSDKHLSV